MFSEMIGERTTRDLYVVHVPKDGSPEFLDITERMLVNPNYDIWGERVRPWLEKRHPEFSGLEMNG